MDFIELSLLLFAVSVLAGVLGSLLGLGGGFVIVPVLSLALHLDIRLAIGTSIVAVAATSSAGAARNVGESITNLRVATFLAMATTIGAVTGALAFGRRGRPVALRALRPGARVLGATDAPLARSGPKPKCRSRRSLACRPWRATEPGLGR